jgi:hypothetical protein
MWIKGWPERGDGIGPLFPATTAGSESKKALEKFEGIDISYLHQFVFGIRDTNCVVPG